MSSFLPFLKTRVTLALFFPYWAAVHKLNLEQNAWRSGSWCCELRIWGLSIAFSAALRARDHQGSAMKGLSPFMSFLPLSAPVGYFWLHTKQFLSLRKSGKCSSLLYLELIGSKNDDFLGMLQNKNNFQQRGFGVIGLWMVKRLPVMASWLSSSLVSFSIKTGFELLGIFFHVQGT